MDLGSEKATAFDYLKKYMHINQYPWLVSFGLSRPIGISKWPSDPGEALYIDTCKWPPGPGVVGTSSGLQT